MKFVKSDLAKKLIIILIVLFLFNVAYPSLCFAADFGGILLSPLFWLLSSIYVPFDLILGSTLVLPRYSFTDITVWTAYVVNPLNKLAQWGDEIWQEVKSWFTGNKKSPENWGSKIGNTFLETVSPTVWVFKTDEKGWYTRTDLEEEYTISELFVGPDTIFKGDIEPLNANIFKFANKAVNSSEWEIMSPMEKVSIAIAKFYVILRNICAVIMLAGLIFTGIRILLSANVPTKKTQYLMMLQDWLIGMGLLIFSHIIMILILEFAETITLALNKSLGIGGIKWITISNMMYSDDSVAQIIALLLYHWIQILTIIFALSYFKRFFWTCILVVFAPVFAVMYALGQQTKQIYSSWLREFILNAMIQPFHLVVYSVLVIMPLNIANGDGWNWSFENGSELSYALMAMSMIKPAEKYLRRLFGLDKGIANMASYDSGKQVITSTMKAAAAVAKTAVSVAAIAATAGAAAPAVGAAGAAGSAAGAAGSAGGAAGALGEAGGALGEAGGMLGDTGSALGDAGNILGEAGDALGGLGEGTDSQPWLSEAWDQDSQGRYLNPYNDEWYTQDELMGGAGMPAYMMDQDDFSEGDIKALTDGLKQEGAAQGTTIDAANVTLNAGAVSMGSSLGASEKPGVETKETRIETIGSGNSGSNDSSDEDDGISLDMPELSGFEAFKNLGGLEKIGELGADLYEGLHSITDGLYVDGTAPTSEWQNNAKWARGNIQQAGEKRKEDIAREKDNWANNKENISIMSNKYYNEKYLPEMTKKYEGQLKSGKVDMNYVQAQAKEKAEEKAKKALKDMSEYVPYGATDVNVAFQLYDNANKNGFTPEQSVRNMAGYAQFNLSAGNVTHVNQSGIYERSDYKSVQAAIPDAKTYYDAGYTKVNEMEWLDSMAQKLGKDPAFAMKVDEALKKKVKGGKLSYNGKDAEMKKVIDQINSHYGG